MSKRISVQWRITILTALLIAAACVSLNLLLFYSGSDSMDALNGFVVEYKTGNQQEMTIEIPQENMQAFFSGFSQQVSAEKVRFERMGWCITALVTLLSAVIAYFVSGRALKPLGDFARQTGQINEESLTDTRLSEDTSGEFGELSRSVNAMLDRLAQSFDTQRQFTGTAAHELRTPLALIQTRLELFAAEHPQMDAETAALLRFEQEQLERLSALVRTLLEMSNLRQVARNEYFFIDMVFYHRILKAHILLEVKISPFDHAHVSQLYSYLNYYKAEVMEPDDNPPIGILLVTNKNDALVQYATAGMDEQIFVSKYKLQLPTEQQLKDLILKTIRQ